MEGKVLNLVARAALMTAKRAVNGASFFGMYQPKQPENLREQMKKIN